MIRLMPVLAAGLLAVLPQVAAADPALVVGDNPMLAGPGLGYPIILTIVDGSTVNTRRCRGAWCEVRIRGRRGFVNVRHLDFAAYVPRSPAYAETRRGARKPVRADATGGVSRGAREFAPRRSAEPPEAPARRLPAAEMPRGPLPPPPKIDPPPTVPAAPAPQAPTKPFKPPQGVPEISL